MYTYVQSVTFVYVHQVIKIADKILLPCFAGGKG